MEKVIYEKAGKKMKKEERKAVSDRNKEIFFDKVIQQKHKNSFLKFLNFRRSYINELKMPEGIKKKDNLKKFIDELKNI